MVLRPCTGFKLADELEGLLPMVEVIHEIETTEPALLGIDIELCVGTVVGFED